MRRNQWVRLKIQGERKLRFSVFIHFMAAEIFSKTGFISETNKHP